ncbi:hypothetical protein BXZ70DRAFT_660970 [Cristinia sonorae]|uniref:Uncharacterized protein n=1 Tax=Cristinia sonorae TaxID=1940300 RepID=A0A8K0XK18_9AGAR|nr:hypothetical protein BXZ70DRAFT_660970 [Cristinia sonorae]
MFLVGGSDLVAAPAPLAKSCMRVFLCLRVKSRRLISCLDRCDTMGILTLFMATMTFVDTSHDVVGDGERIKKYMYRCLFHVLLLKNLPPSERRIYNAWYLLMFELAHGRGTQLAQHLLQFVKPGRGHTAFLLQLVDFKSNRWKYFPKSLGTALVSQLYAPAANVSDQDALDHGFLDVLGVFASEAPKSLVQTFSMHMFLQIILVDLQPINDVGGQPMQRFFNYLAELSFGRSNTTLAAWETLPPSVGTFANFVCHVPSDSLHTLVAYIMDAMTPFAVQDPEERTFQQSREDVVSQHRNCLSMELCHATYPFLRFTYFLLHSHPDAPRVFLDAGLLSTLEGLWINRFPEHFPGYLDFLKSGLLLTVGVISKRRELWPRLFSSRFSSWFVNSRMYRWYLPPPLEHVEVRYLIVAIMHHLTVTQSGQRLETGLCHDFLTVLSEADAQDHTLLDSGIIVLLCCASLPEERGRPLSHALRMHGNPERIPTLLQKVCEFLDRRNDSLVILCMTSRF